MASRHYCTYAQGGRCRGRAGSRSCPPDTAKVLKKRREGGAVPCLGGGAIGPVEKEKGGLCLVWEGAFVPEEPRFSSASHRLFNGRRSYGSPP